MTLTISKIDEVSNESSQTHDANSYLREAVQDQIKFKLKNQKPLDHPLL